MNVVIVGFVGRKLFVGYISKYSYCLFKSTDKKMFVIGKRRSDGCDIVCQNMTTMWLLH